MTAREEVDQLNEAIAEQHRAYFTAARALGLPIGHLTPEEAIRQIIKTGCGPTVANTARRMFPEAFKV